MSEVKHANANATNTAASPRKALTKHKPRWMLMPCSGEKPRRIIRSKIYFLRSNA